MWQACFHVMCATLTFVFWDTQCTKPLGLCVYRSEGLAANTSLWPFLDSCMQNSSFYMSHYVLQMLFEPAVGSCRCIWEGGETRPWLPLLMTWAQSGFGERMHSSMQVLFCLTHLCVILSFQANSESLFDWTVLMSWHLRTEVVRNDLSALPFILNVKLVYCFNSTWHWGLYSNTDLQEKLCCSKIYLYHYCMLTSCKRHALSLMLFWHFAYSEAISRLAAALSACLMWWSIDFLYLLKKRFLAVWI